MSPNPETFLRHLRAEGDLVPVMSKRCWALPFGCWGNRPRANSLDWRGAMFRFPRSGGPAIER